MSNSLDYLKHKRYQAWIYNALFFILVVPYFYQEVNHYLSENFFWLNILHKLSATAIAVLALITTVKSIPSSKKMKKQLAEETKENHYKVLKIITVIYFPLLSVFQFCFDMIDFLEPKTILGIILCCMGLTAYASFLILYRKDWNTNLKTQSVIKNIA